MGMNDASSGYKKLKNDKGYTSKDILSLLEGTKFSFGEPKLGTIAKKESVVFDPIGQMTVYITASPKAIEIARVVTKGTGKFVLKELALAMVTDAQSSDVADADRAVDEVYEVIKGLLENGIVENKSSASIEMKLYMEQKILTIKDKYNICTEDRQPAYWVEGSLTGLGYKIEDPNGNLLLEIKKKLVAIMPEYSILQNGKSIGTLKKKMKLTRPLVTGTINGEDLELKGDISGYHFAFLLGGKTVGSVDTVRLTWGDAYEIKINDTQHKDLIVAIAVIVDNLLKGK